MPVIGWIFAVWSTYAFHMTAAGRLDRLGHIKGHDFVHFYMIGEIGVDRASKDLYEGEAHWVRTDRLVPEYEVRYMPIHPPQVAMFFAPLAKPPYLVALTIWLIGSTGVYVLCCALVWSSLPNLRQYRGIVAMSAAALPAFYSLIAAGQTSAFALLWFTLGYLFLRSERPWLAGACLGMLVYKPTLVLVFPFVFVFNRQWRVLFGASVAALAQFAIAGAYFGWPTLVEWVRALFTGISAIDQLESQPWQMHSLRALFANSVPWPSVAAALQITTSLWAVTFAVRTWKSSESLAVRYAVFLLATVLVSPHVYTYELVVLVPAYLQVVSMAVERRADSRQLWAALYAAVYLPGLSLIAAASYVQWSVLAMLWLMLLLGKPSLFGRAPALAPEPQERT
ncbi:MAG: glycosyltransferase family 87 protein [Vicinamibacterales bacterium]